MTEEHLAAVHKALKAQLLDYEVTIEWPRFIRVEHPTTAPYGWSLGDANVTWGGSFDDADCHVVESFETSLLPGTSYDPQYIAAYLITCITRRPRPCQDTDAALNRAS